MNTVNTEAMKISKVIWSCRTYAQMQVALRMILLWERKHSFKGVLMQPCTGAVLRERLGAQRRKIFRMENARALQEDKS